METEESQNREDLHAGDGERNGFDVVMPKEEVIMDEREIWFERENDDLLAANDHGSIFYGDFPPFPDFPCMSSSSSTSSAPAPTNPSACATSSSSLSSSSSSAASLAVLQSDAAADDAENSNSHPHNHQDQYNHGAEPPSTPQTAAAESSTVPMEVPPPLDVDCMAVMENFGCIDLLEPNDIWDPSSIFPQENSLSEFQRVDQQLFQEPLQVPLPPQATDETSASEDLAAVFFEWLKSNKESICAEDLRKIKLRRATIECAARRLGGGKEGTKQLLKLILEWVQQHQLHKKREQELPYPFQNPNPNPKSVANDSNPCYRPPLVAAYPPYVSDLPVMASAATAAPPAYRPMVGYIGGDPFCASPFQAPSEYQTMESAPTWSSQQFNLPSQYNNPFSDNNLPLPQVAPDQHAFGASYAGQFPCPFYRGNGEGLVRLGVSATKEARKKRMARQRRFLSHHHRSHHSQENQAEDMCVEQQREEGGENCTTTDQANNGNWVYRQATGPTSVQPGMPVDAPQPHSDRPAQNYQRQFGSDRRQKVLKQSDVGSLGRIVLPKKEAETHLPELEARDGISIAMEDIGTSRVWNMRYRFWPNNKSRMYLLENTGDFIKSNGLQEGDFIVIYSDVKCGKYMIRGVKVRQQGPKTNTKKSGKGQRTGKLTNIASSSSSSPTTETPK
ncbi:B3 domain-containing transcription factor ABI3 isoform X2 [Malania oleifera]|uniref:B3 domain-containing transcription factor ABI3 isoform X2 n=1 Tax=Malania oleifera TaxID=397392 RepID=UPI0025AE562F|nr:B3 domain-containing transcription factor ABI3 isoform X2 [Malania oleifera]